MANLYRSIGMTSEEIIEIVLKHYGFDVNSKEIEDSSIEVDGDFFNVSFTTENFPTEPAKVATKKTTSKKGSK